MRLTYNRPPKVSILRELDSLGMPVEFRNQPISELHFPNSVKDTYMEVWDKFIETTAAKELYSRGISPLHGNFNVAISFVSYLETITSDAMHTRYDIIRISDTILKSALTDLRKLLPGWLKRKRIDKAFKLSDIETIVTPDYNELLGAYIDVSASIFLTFTPAKKRKLSKTDFGIKSVPNSLDPILYSRQRYMFGSGLPVQLKGTLRNRGSEKKIYAYPDLANVKEKRTTLWHLMDAIGNMKIYAHRSGEDSFTLKFTIDTPALYLGGGMTATKLNKLIGSKIESILKLR